VVYTTVLTPWEAYPGGIYNTLPPWEAYPGGIYLSFFTLGGIPGWYIPYVHPSWRHTRVVYTLCTPLREAYAPYVHPSGRHIPPYTHPERHIYHPIHTQEAYIHQGGSREPLLRLFPVYEAPGSLF